MKLDDLSKRMMEYRNVKATLNLATCYFEYRKNQRQDTACFNALLSHYI